MSPACAPPAPNPWTAGPADPQDAAAGHRILRLIGPLVVLAALALMIIAIANVQVARRRATVERELGLAHSASAALPRDLAAANPTAVTGDLRLLTQSSAAARRQSDGVLWELAGRVDPGGRQLAAIRRDVQHSATLAAAGDPLGRALAPLSENAGSTGTGPADLTALDDLARGLSTYTSAAFEVGDPSGPALARSTMAAGLLPDLLGAETSRSWTICRTTTGPCVSTTLTSGLLGPIAATPAGPTQTHDSDLLIVGLDPASLFTGSTPPGGPPALRLPAVFALLCRLTPATGGPRLSVHSVVEQEQYTLSRLAGPAPS